MRIPVYCTALFAVAATSVAPALADHQVTIKNCIYSGGYAYHFNAYDSTDTSYTIKASQRKIIYLETGTLHCDAHGKGFCKVQAVSLEGEPATRHHHVYKEATFFDDDVGEGILPCPSD